MLWILPKFFSRNKNVVYLYLGKKGCDENDEAKGRGKVLDPGSPSAFAALITLIFMGTGLDRDVAGFEQQLDDAVTKAFWRNWGFFRL